MSGLEVALAYPVFEPPLGGVERYFLEVGRELSALGHRVRVVTGPRRAGGEDEAPFEVWRHGEVKPRGLGLLRRPWAETEGLVGALAGLPGVDLAVARFPTYAVALARRGVRVVYLPAEEIGSRVRRERAGAGVWRQAVSRWLEPQWVRVEARALELASRVVVLSRSMAKRLACHGAGGARAEVVPPGVDTERFRPDPEARARIRRRLGIGDEVPLVLSVSRLSPEKNLGFGLEVLARLPREVRYAIAGSGDGRQALLAEAARLGLGDRLSLVGAVAEPEAWYAAADVFFHPSTSEGFGHVLVEAMASGLPVVAISGATGAEVATEEVVPPAAGRGVPAGDAGVAAAVVRELLADRQECLAMGRAGRAHVEARFSWRRHVECLLGGTS